MIRMPAVAGQFYNSDSRALELEVESFTLDMPKQDVIAIVSPHAGLIYSGSVAGAVYSQIQIPDTVVLIGPNHTGLGQQFSIMAEGEWVVPTHSFPIDKDIAEALLKSSKLFKADTSSHTYEHSLEVQLPFIAHFSKSVKIVPITVMGATIEQCKEMAGTLSEVVNKSNKKVVIVASSDMSHFISDAQARYKDNLAIQKILNLDPAGLYETVKEESISMCGYLPSTIMLYTALSLNATSAELVKYTTSAETSGDYNRVVGYAGIVVK